MVIWVFLAIQEKERDSIRRNEQVESIGRSFKLCKVECTSWIHWKIIQKTKVMIDVQGMLHCIFPIE